MERTDNRLGLLLGYMRVGVGVRVGRGVIVIVIGMVMVRVTGVIVGSVRLRWRVSINMIVILDIWKSLRSVYELRNMQAKGRSGNREKGQEVGGGWGRIDLIRPAYYLPLCLPLCHTQGGPVARRFGESIFPSTCNTQRTTPGLSPRGSAVPHYPGDASTCVPHTAGGGGLGRVVMCAFVYPWTGKRKPNPTGAVWGCELGIETV